MRVPTESNGANNNSNKSVHCRYFRCCIRCIKSTPIGDTVANLHQNSDLVFFIIFQKCITAVGFWIPGQDSFYGILVGTKLTGSVVALFCKRLIWQSMTNDKSTILFSLLAKDPPWFHWVLIPRYVDCFCTTFSVFAWHFCFPTLDLYYSILALFRSSRSFQNLLNFQMPRDDLLSFGEKIDVKASRYPRWSPYKGVRLLR